MVFGWFIKNKFFCNTHGHTIVRIAHHCVSSAQIITAASYSFHNAIMPLDHVGGTAVGVDVLRLPFPILGIFLSGSGVLWTNGVYGAGMGSLERAFAKCRIVRISFLVLRFLPILGISFLVLGVLCTNGVYGAGMGRWNARLQNAGTCKRCLFTLTEALLRLRARWQCKHAAMQACLHYRPQAYLRSWHQWLRAAHTRPRESTGPREA